MCRLFYLIASLLYHYFTVVLLNHCLYLLVHVFCREAQLFVQHFVRSGETERFQSPNLTVGAYQAFQRNGQAGGQTEYFCICRNHALLIARSLTAEQSLGRNRYDAQLDTVLA